MIVLALDTALAATSAALLDNDVVLARRVEPMERGHQERLAIAVRETVLEAGLPFSAVERVGVTVGPGSFTGLRVGLAFAKGLALSLGVPCVGIGTLEALAASAPSSGWVAAAIDARRGGIYLQVFQDAIALDPPQTVSPEEAVAYIRFATSAPVMLVGPGSWLLTEGLGVPVIGDAYPDARQVARLARQAVEPIASPKPLYLRGADAKTLLERSRSA